VETRARNFFCSKIVFSTPAQTISSSTHFITAAQVVHSSWLQTACEMTSAHDWFKEAAKEFQTNLRGGAGPAGIATDMPCHN
jgi:hypothetical protein